MRPPDYAGVLLGRRNSSTCAEWGWYRMRRERSFTGWMACLSMNCNGLNQAKYYRRTKWATIHAPAKPRSIKCDLAGGVGMHKLRISRAKQCMHAYTRRFWMGRLDLTKYSVCWDAAALHNWHSRSVHRSRLLCIAGWHGRDSGQAARGNGTYSGVSFCWSFACIATAVLCISVVCVSEDGSRSETDIGCHYEEVWQASC